jgi:hypothetical protein
LFAGLLSAHAVGDDEEVGGFEGESDVFGVAIATAIEAYGASAWDVEVVFVVFAIVTADGDDADPELELAGEEGEGREGGEFVGGLAVVIGGVAAEPPFDPMSESGERAHAGFILG